MGYPPELFTKPQIEDQFICTVCHDVLQEPLILHPCEHAVCTICTFGMFGVGAVGERLSLKICRVDRCQSSIDLFKEPQRLFLELLNAHELMCPHNSEGCTAVVELGDLPAHEKKCGFNPKNLKECDGGCGAVINVNRNNGAQTHNCVQHMQKRLEDKEAELRVTQKELEDCRRELKQKDIDMTKTKGARSAESAEPSSPPPMKKRSLSCDSYVMRKLGWNLTTGHELDSD